GVTSNPTIFERAISGSSDYDAGLRDALDRGVDEPEALFWDLAVDDIRDAADVLRDVHDASDGTDGFVSLELPPRLSRDTDGSVELGVGLFARLDRPNVMIKVPGTPEGVAAIEELTARGVHVNVTLLFSLPQWQAVADAYLRGLERRAADGQDLRVSSVASYFISRIDGLANDRLPDDLHNRLGVASAQLAYAAYHRLLAGDRWKRLADRGARPQRLLWASTSTKDPTLPETFYVQALAAPGTVNTMPEATMRAFAKSGELDGVLPRDGGDAATWAADAAEHGVDLDGLGQELQEAGDAAFAESFDRLLACIGVKADALASGVAPGVRRLGPTTDAVDAALADLAERDAVRRLWQRDHTLWHDDPTEIADRLGWLAVPEVMEAQVERLEAFAGQARADGLTHALVLGMGGSSLFPLVVADVFPTGAQGLELAVLDSDDPAAIARVERDLPLERTLVIASSKSGTTAETRALLEHFWAASGRGEHFAVITDPGTELATLGAQRGFRAVFEAGADIGGRYAALSHFGLVPAALAGVDVAELLHRAGRMAAASADCVRAEDNAGLQLAGLLAGATRAGRDKLTLVIDERVATFGLWIEQLIAESTGKQGAGIVPVVGEPLGDPEVYGHDRLFVGIGVDPQRLAPLADAGHPVAVLALDDPVDLGAEVLRWEIATALAGAALGINPFDQPDVEAAKDAARTALESGVPTVDPGPAHQLLDQLVPGDYLAIQAYVDSHDPLVDELERIRVVLRDRYRVATTVGIGPRYLHSTGQLHKGGPPSGVFVQLVTEGGGDPPIPGQRFGFATLERAQAGGDLQALREGGRRAGRVLLDDLRKVTA
ncbi:MAG: bifunctional transaldolase/phosoglucose isomerase, partial [Egibacteraceae bacterium]